MQGMSLHHVFLAVERGGPEVDALVGAGFTEGPSNVHHGQGTACRRFFFGNAYLEFLWLENRTEASSPVVSRTGLEARLGAGVGSSRIGICIRLPSDLSGPPVSTWVYRPPYLPPGVSISMAANSLNLEEPLLFFLPTGIAPPRTTPGHRNGVRAISRITVAHPATSKPSPELEWLVDSGLAAFDSAPAESVQVEFDGGLQGRGLTLDTPTPLLVTW